MAVAVLDEAFATAPSPAGVVGAGHRHADITPAARELAATVEVADLAAHVTADILDDVWPEFDDASFRAAVHRSVLDNLEAIFAVISGRLEIEHAHPSGPLEFAEVAATLDVPASDVERAYRIGIASLWRRWFDLSRARAERDAAPLAELVSGPPLTILEYCDHILAEVVSRHRAVRAELGRTQRDVRRMILRQLVDGTLDELSDDLNRTLDYHLGDTHLAMLVETQGVEPPKREIAALRAAADARGTLLLQHGPRSWVAWLGFRTGFGATQRSRLQRALSDAGLTIAVGEPGTGLAGLRRSRRQALEAAAVQRSLDHAPQRCIWASEVRLETLLLSDEERAREFIADELGALAASDSRAERLRETLLAWLATGSHVSAAATLGVHENTVRNRLRSAEALLGAGLATRRTELQVALRLHSVFSAPTARPGHAHRFD